MSTFVGCARRTTAFQSQRSVQIISSGNKQRTDETDASERNSLVHACPGSFFPHLRLDSWVTCQYRWHCHFAILCRTISNVNIRFYTCLSRRLQSCELSSYQGYTCTDQQGRSSAAVSSNSFVRGCLACVMSQIARPIQDAIGDGGLYTIFAGMLALSSLGIMLVARKFVICRSQ